jgi:hypothetical protein
MPSEAKRYMTAAEGDVGAQFGVIASTHGAGRASNTLEDRKTWRTYSLRSDATEMVAEE